MVLGALSMPATPRPKICTDHPATANDSNSVAEPCEFRTRFEWPTCTQTYSEPAPTGQCLQFEAIILNIYPRTAELSNRGAEHAFCRGTICAGRSPVPNQI